MVYSRRLYLLTWHVYVPLIITAVLNCVAMQHSPPFNDFITLANFCCPLLHEQVYFPSACCRGLFLTLFLGQVGLRRKESLER